MKTALRWLTGLTVLIGQALLAFAIARLLNPNAMLVGPFLLISPFLAVSVATLFFVRASNEPELSKSTEEIIQRITRFDHRLKKQPEIRFSSTKGSKVAVQRSRSGIIVNARRWDELSSGEKDFLLARVLAELEADERGAKGRYLWKAVLILAGVAAALSLWSILFSHSMLAIYGVASIRDRARTQGLAADRRAVELTKDKSSALRVARVEHSKSPNPFVSLEERLEVIESVELNA